MAHKTVTITDELHASLRELAARRREKLGALVARLLGAAVAHANRKASTRVTP